MRRICYRRFI